MNAKRILHFSMLFMVLIGLMMVQAAAPMGVSYASSALSSSGIRIFWYDRTFGETEVPYFADNDHLYNPDGVGVDSAGNVWVAESLGARAMKYSSAGTFLMSIGTPGRAWLADNKHISVPMDITVDNTGNVWVVDQNSHRAVKYDASGNYLMQLGVTWEGGSDNNHFSYPWSLALDSSGRIYVSDAGNNRIQVFNSDGTYNTTIGVTGVAGSDNSHFNSPWHIAIDQDNNLYIADLGNERVQIFNGSHTWVSTLGTTGAIGDDNGHFNNPRGVAVDAGRIYVADGGNHRVQIFDRGTRGYLATLGIGGGRGDYQFIWPGDVAVDSNGYIYVADNQNNRVQKFDKNLNYVRTIGTTGVPYLTDDVHYYMPDHVAVDAEGNIGIVEDDFRGHRFIKLNQNGVPQFTIGEAGVKGGDEAHFANPTGVAFDADGNIYIADEWNHRIQIFSSDGTYQNTLGTGWGSGPYQFKYPGGVAVDAGGNIYVADSNNQRVQIFDSSRTYKATLGITGQAGSDEDHFNQPTDVEVDASGNIYVVDVYNGRIQKFNSNHAWQMTLGDFWGPSGVAIDLSGNIYVSVFWTNQVHIFTANGVYMTTIGGDSGNQVDQFRHPSSVAVDAQGNVFITDKDNARVQKYVPGKLLFVPLIMRN
ncbi:MAG: NHL repeat-containing protein [Chloroflexi bacterium]|nr:NHL repeat-containing protein [Chloroflexota bacterium]